MTDDEKSNTDENDGEDDNHRPKPKFEGQAMLSDEGEDESNTNDSEK